MKKTILSISVIVSFLIPSVSYAAITATWNATSTDKGYIQPDKIIGNQPWIQADHFVATSTSATSTFQNIQSNLSAASYFYATSSSLTSYLKGALKVDGNYNSTNGNISLINGSVTVGPNSAANAATFVIGNWFSSAYPYSSPPAGGANIFAASSNDLYPGTPPLALVIKHNTTTTGTPYIGIVGTFAGNSGAPIHLGGDYGCATYPDGCEQFGSGVIIDCPQVGLNAPGLDVCGGETVGSDAVGVHAAPTNGLFVEGASSFDDGTINTDGNGNITPTGSQSFGNSSHLWSIYTANVSSGNCAKVLLGLVTDAGAPCGTGSGTVNSSSQGNNAVYNANGTAVSGTSTIFEATNSNVGISSTTPWAKFGVSMFNFQGANPPPLFVVASSSLGVSTSTAFYVAPTGEIGMSTTSPDGAPCSAELCVINKNNKTNIFSFFNNTNNSELTLTNGGTLTTGSGLTVNGGSSLTSGATITSSAIGTAAVTLQGRNTGQTGNVFNVLPFGNGQTIQDVISSLGYFGTGTSTPWAQLSVGVPIWSATVPMFAIGSSTTSGTTTPFEIDGNGNPIFQGIKPTVACSGTCNLETHSTDAKGIIYISGVQTSVTLTFTSAKPWAPACVASDNVTAGNYDASSTPTTVVFSTAVSLGTASLSYWCPL